ncbi:hypothetical protein IWW36_003622 [Coemansia brasiliensis]|uniref:BAG domain-containing protein n=1 Tax=Coemansia brasiliensis TaxID=2650707 RepID=A0A9W8LZV7_9FUNG|nr:hypothetical protein IWW36_003622 [Coemansia brasiliensis]
MQYPLDRLHYAMFQLLLAIAIPVVVVLSRWPGDGYRLEFARYECQPQTRTESQSNAKQSIGNSHADSKVGSQLRSGQHRYSEQCVDIERKFMQMALSEESDAASSPWMPLTEMKHPYPITVQGHKSKPFCFRVVFYAPTASGTAFDLLASVLRRPEWDELTESTKIIETLGPGDAIHYVKMKPVWPTAARDSLLLSHLAAVQAHSRPGYLNVSMSIQDSRVPEYNQAGIVRMEAGIAGQLITNVTEQEREQLGLASGTWCKVVQVADGDLKGWIPKSVIKFIATQALPRSLTKFFLDDSDTVPIRLFSASNAPQRNQYSAPLARQTPMLRGNRSVPNYPYIRFVNDDDYDGSYPFDAFQDLRSAYSSSSLSRIQEQMREIQRQRAQAQLHRSLLEQQLRAFEQREKELMEYQRQIEQQRKIQAQRAAQLARNAYKNRLKQQEQQMMKAESDDAQRFYPPFQFFDHILNNQMRSQDDFERKRAHKSALSELLDTYFADHSLQQQQQKDIKQASPEKQDSALLSPATSSPSDKQEQREESRSASSEPNEASSSNQLPYVAMHRPYMEPAVLDSVLRVVHDRLDEIAAQEAREKSAESTPLKKEDEEKSPSAAITSPSDNDRVNVDVIEEEPEEEGIQKTKIQRNSPSSKKQKQADDLVEVEEPTDYKRLAQLLRNRVHRLNEDDMFLPPPSPQPSTDSEDSETEDKQDSSKDIPTSMDIDKEHSDSDFANMMDTCKCQLRDMQEAAAKSSKKDKAKRRHHRKYHHRRPKSSKKRAVSGSTDKLDQQQPAPNTIEDYILGTTNLEQASNSAGIRESMGQLQVIERELDQVRRDYSQQLSDTQLSFIADKNGNLRLAYNRGNAVFHAYQEILQKLLLRLDAIPSYGDQQVRSKRRSIVKKIQAIVDSLDQFAADQESSTDLSSEVTPYDDMAADVSSNAE